MPHPDREICWRMNGVRPEVSHIDIVTLLGKSHIELEVLVHLTKHPAID